MNEELESLKARHSKLWIERQSLIERGDKPAKDRIREINEEMRSIGIRLRQLKGPQPSAVKFVPTKTMDWQMPTNATPALIEKLNAIGEENPKYGQKVKCQLLKIYNEFGAHCELIRRATKTGTHIRLQLVDVAFFFALTRAEKSRRLSAPEVQPLLTWYRSMLSALRYETKRRIGRQLRIQKQKPHATVS